MPSPYAKYTGQRIQPLPPGYIQGYAQGGAGIGAGLQKLGEGVGENLKEKQAAAFFEAIRDKVNEAKGRQGQARAEAAQVGAGIDVQQNTVNQLNQSFPFPDYAPTEDGVDAATAMKVGEFWQLRDRLKETAPFALEPGYKSTDEDLSSDLLRFHNLKDELEPTGYLDPTGPGVGELGRNLGRDLAAGAGPLLDRFTGGAEMVGAAMGQAAPDVGSLGRNLAGGAGLMLDRFTGATGGLPPEIPPPGGAPPPEVSKFDYPARLRQDLQVNDPPELLAAFRERDRLTASIEADKAQIPGLLRKAEEAEAVPIDMGNILMEALSDGPMPDPKTFLDVYKEVGKQRATQSTLNLREEFMNQGKKKKAVDDNLASINFNAALTPAEGNDPLTINKAWAVTDGMKRLVDGGQLEGATFVQKQAVRRELERQAEQMALGGTAAGQAQLLGKLKENFLQGSNMMGDDARLAFERLLGSSEITRAFPNLDPVAEAKKAFPPSAFMAEKIPGTEYNMISVDGKPWQMVKGATPPAPMVWGYVSSDTPAGKELNLPADTTQRVVNGKPDGAPFKITQEDRSLVVPGLGTKAKAYSGNQAAEIRDMMGEAKGQLSILGDMISISERAVEGLSPTQRRIAIQNAAILAGKLRLTIIGPGAMSDYERKILEKVVGNPAELLNFEEAERAAFGNLKRRLRETMRNKIEFNVENAEVPEWLKEGGGSGASTPTNVPGGTSIVPANFREQDIGGGLAPR